MCDKDEREDCPKLCSREDGCNYPFIRSDEFKTNCDVTIAEYIDPFHWACCLVYGFASLLLAYITFLWAYTIWLDLSNRHVSARVVRLQKTKMYMNTFICVGCVINLVACVDLKSYGNRIPLVATEVLSDVSIALFCCALFFMITLWVDAIGMGGLSLWARRNKTALPFACATVCVLRIVLGILQWLLAPQGERSYSGTINVVKLTLTVLAAVTYSAVGLYASIYAPSADADARRSEDMEGGDRAGGPWAAAMGVLKMTRQRQVLHQRYLVALTAVLVCVSAYLFYAAKDRTGQTEKRTAPCGLQERLLYTNQGTVILLALVFVAVSFSSESKRVGTWYPQSKDARRQLIMERHRRAEEKLRERARSQQSAVLAADANSKKGADVEMSH